jgi:hypothetical protein
MIRIVKEYGRTALSAIVVLCLLASVVPAAAQHDPEVFGRTYGEWSGEWWNWMFSFPAETSPIFAEGETDCVLGQNGKVLFLAGNMGGESSRACTIPKGKALLVPIANSIFWAPEDGDTEEEIRPQVEAAVDSVTDVTCTLDGVPCEYHHLIVRTQSPAFTMSIPEGSLLHGWGLDAGDRYPAISDGYWVMLPAQSPGDHTLEFSASFGDPFNFDLAVTYLLTVD